MVTYAKDVVLGVRPFTVQPFGDEIIIGNADTGVFLAVPPEAVDVLQDLARGKSVGQALELYQQKYGETPDLDDFLAQLERTGIVEAQGDGLKPDGAGAPPGSRRRYHFRNFPQRLAQRLFSTPVLASCFIVIALALTAIAVNHALLPVPGDIVFLDHRAVTWLILAILDVFIVFIHEFAHLVAARAQGIDSRMGLSNRLWNVVAETDLTGLWGVPKAKRYKPMLAGMLADAVSSSLLVLLECAHDNHLVALQPFALRLLRALIFGYVLRLLWEFFLFMRTDIYYVIATYANCKNLLGDTEVFLRNQLSRFVPSIAPVDQSAIRPFEMKVVRAYSFIWIGGRVWATFLLFWVTVPVAISYVRDLHHVFTIGYASNPGTFIDAVLLATIFLVPTTAGLILWVHSWAHNLVNRKRS